MRRARERAAAIEVLLRTSPSAIHPVVRAIIQAGQGVSGVDTFRGLYALQGHARASSPRRVPCNDATGRVLSITPEEQAQKARAITAFVDQMLAMPDEDDLRHPLMLSHLAS